MTSLITCCDEKFLIKAIKCLQNSYLSNPDINHCLYFIGDSINIDVPNFIQIKFIPKEPNILTDPYLFAYKYWSILEEFKQSEIVLYTDSTHLISKKLPDLDHYFYNDCFILPYKSGQFLIKNWTSKHCIEKLSGDSYLEYPQVWAGFQGYRKTPEIINFITKVLKSCLDPSLSGPYPSIQNPDGISNPCIYHRNDQSILSIELLKHNLYPNFLKQKDYEFGDYISVKYFYPNEYDGDVLNSIYRYLYPRYFKNNN